MSEVAKFIWYLFGPKALFLYGKPFLTALPDVSKSRFVFICGLHRSGTSVVHRSLRNSPYVSGFHDTSVPEDEAQHLQNVLPSGRQLGGPGCFAFHPEAHLTEKSVLLNSFSDTRETLLKQWGSYLDLSKTFFIEKSPPNLTRTRLLQSLFPGSVFIFLVRHPIPVSLATHKRWGGKFGVNDAICHWCQAHEYMLEDIHYLENFYIKSCQ